MRPTPNSSNSSTTRPYVHRCWDAPQRAFRCHGSTLPLRSQCTVPGIAEARPGIGRCGRSLQGWPVRSGVLCSSWVRQLLEFMVRLIPLTRPSFRSGPDFRRWNQKAQDYSCLTVVPTTSIHCIPGVTGAPHAWAFVTEPERHNKTDNRIKNNQRSCQASTETGTVEISGGLSWNPSTWGMPDLAWVRSGKPAHSMRMRYALQFKNKGASR